MPRWTVDSTISPRDTHLNHCDTAQQIGQVQQTDLCKLHSGRFPTDYPTYQSARPFLFVLFFRQLLLILLLINPPVIAVP